MASVSQATGQLQAQRHSDGYLIFGGVGGLDDRPAKLGSSPLSLFTTLGGDQYPDRR